MSSYADTVMSQETMEALKPWWSTRDRKVRWLRDDSMWRLVGSGWEAQWLRIHPPTHPTFPHFTNP